MVLQHKMLFSERMGTEYIWLKGTCGGFQSNPVFKAGPVRSDCSGLCPAELLMPLRIEILQPFWATFSNT